MGNATVEITAQSPLLRPGLTVTVRVSERYAEGAAEALMAVVRKINSTDSPRSDHE